MIAMERVRQNRLLSMLPAGELESLWPALTVHTGKLRDVLQPRGCLPSHVYFPLSGMVSMTSLNETGREIEVATIGYEGMAGIDVFLGGESDALESYIQIAGELLRLKRDVFERYMSRPAIDQVLKRYTHALFTQVAQASACNRIHPIEQRCARWLLQSHDRMRLQRFELTHEFLAIMLGVRRASVSEVAAKLQGLGLIRYHRGVVDVIDRAGLEQFSCTCYAIIASEYERALRMTAALAERPTGRALILDHLAMAERHVVEGMQRISRQRELIEQLRSGSRDIQTAEALLDRFEQTLQLHMADRDRLRNALAE